MFSHEGPSRSPKKNAIVAGYLAFVAGFVNSGGFLLIGSFTSHVTGSVGRMSTDLAARDLGAAALALLMVVSFFLGAFAATLLIEGHARDQVPRAYGRALGVEAALLAAFVVVAGLSLAAHPRLLDAEAAILCAAMGLQNSLVTKLSGSVVRTTHLTGVVTDLAIEAGRWWRFMLGRGAERPEPVRAQLLGIIMAAFVGGAVAGALATSAASRWAMAVPAVFVAAAALWGLLQSPARMSLFHITTAADWASAQEAGAYRPPSLGTEGFVHLSSAEQWPRTLKRFFAGRTGLVLLELDEAKLQGEVRWDAADGERFPHHYAALNLDAVIRVTPIENA